MSKINAPRGTADTLPAESWKWQAIEAIAREVSALYHFSEIRTPIYESSDLFHRGVGETTDIVSKETFTFLDRGGDSITLRPEGTAGVVRAAIENNLIAQEGAAPKSSTSAPTSATNAPKKAASDNTTNSAQKPSASPTPSKTSSASSSNSTSTAAADSKIWRLLLTASATRKANSAIATRW